MDSRRRHGIVLSFLPLIPTLFLLSCAKEEGSDSVAFSSGSAAYCRGDFPTAPVASSSGSGRIFPVDPMVSSDDPALSPGNASGFDAFTESTGISNLSGRGVLSGKYGRVFTDRCQTESGGITYGAFSSDNDFNYPHSDDRFAEVMTYYHGDRFLSDLESSLSEQPSVAPMSMIANCDVKDNAYYSPAGPSSPAFVCMGYSSLFKGKTSFADDAQVITHEIQHAVTGESYSLTEDFNKLDYDEAGAINEGVSDFVALMMADPSVQSARFFNHEFSRWGLGQLMGTSYMRGAAKCPTWTADYPTCASFNKGPSGFSAAQGRISFAYPDGLGWPYSGPAAGVSSLKKVWRDSSGFEQIHQTAPIITGALFDSYESLKSQGVSAVAARRRLMRVLVEAIKILPKATPSNVSPVTMPSFSRAFLSVAADPAVGGVFSSAELTAMQDRFRERGLIDLSMLPSGWASVGPGVSTAVLEHAQPGTFFHETRGTLNYRLQRGDRGAIWFDVQNTASMTAAAPLLKVRIDSPYVRFSSASLNPGYLGPKTAQIRYGKINGTGIVARMNDDAGAGDKNTGMQNRYFGDDPKSNEGYMPTGVNVETALYIEVDSALPSGAQSVKFEVEIEAENASGPENLVFEVTIP